MEERRQSAILRDELRAQELTLEASLQAIAELEILAPHDGIVSDVPTTLHAGRHIKQTERLMRLVAANDFEMLALPREDMAARLKQGAAFTFISDDLRAPSISGELHHIAPTSEAVISQKVLTSLAGGPLAVHEADNGHIIADNAVFKVRGRPEDFAVLARAQRGIVKIDAEAQSPAQALWRSIVRVLIRETDF